MDTGEVHGPIAAQIKWRRPCRSGSPHHRRRSDCRYRLSLASAAAHADSQSLLRKNLTVRIRLRSETVGDGAEIGHEQPYSEVTDSGRSMVLSTQYSGRKAGD